VKKITAGYLGHVHKREIKSIIARVGLGTTAYQKGDTSGGTEESGGESYGFVEKRSWSGTLGKKTGEEKKGAKAGKEKAVSTGLI